MTFVKRPKDVQPKPLSKKRLTELAKRAQGNSPKARMAKLVLSVYRQSQIRDQFRPSRKNARAVMKGPDFGFDKPDVDRVMATVRGEQPTKEMHFENIVKIAEEVDEPAIVLPNHFFFAW